MLYMNEDKSKRTEDKEQDDLFGYHDLTSDPEPEADALADVEPSRVPEEQNLTPETLPLIQEEKPPQKPVQVEQKTKKAPLIFSAHAPIPTLEVSGRKMTAAGNAFGNRLPGRSPR